MLIRVIYGKYPVAAIAASGALQVEGDGAVLARFIDLFALRPKVD